MERGRGGEEETETECTRPREFSERRWWQIDYGTDVVLELVLMAAFLGG